MLAYHGVVSATDSKDIHPAGDFSVAEQCGAGHGAIPVAIETSKRQHGGERRVVDSFHFNAAEKCVWQPDERADALPEMIANGKAADESFNFIKPTLTPI